MHHLLAQTSIVFQVIISFSFLLFRFAHPPPCLLPGSPKDSVTNRQTNGDDQVALALLKNARLPLHEFTSGHSPFGWIYFFSFSPRSLWYFDRQVVNQHSDRHIPALTLPWIDPNQSSGGSNMRKERKGGKIIKCERKNAQEE